MNFRINRRPYYSFRRVPSGTSELPVSTGANKILRLFSEQALINAFNCAKELPTERGIIVLEPTYNGSFPQKDLQRNTNFPQTEKNLAELYLQLMAQRLGTAPNNLSAQIQIEADINYGTITMKMIDWRTKEFIRSYSAQSLSVPRGYSDFTLPEEPKWRELYVKFAQEYLEICNRSPEELRQNSWGQFYYLQIYNPQKIYERALRKLNGTA